MHIKKYFNALKKKTIIGDDEKEMDNLALNQMISYNVYKEMISDFSHKEEICKKNYIPLCFLYTRLAKEGIISYSSKDYINNIERI